MCHRGHRVSGFCRIAAMAVREQDAPSDRHDVRGRRVSRCRAALGSMGHKREISGDQWPSGRSDHRRVTTGYEEEGMGKSIGRPSPDWERVSGRLQVGQPHESAGPQLRSSGHLSWASHRRVRSARYRTTARTRSTRSAMTGAIRHTFSANRPVHTARMTRATQPRS